MIYHVVTYRPTSSTQIDPSTIHNIAKDVVNDLPTHITTSPTTPQTIPQKTANTTNPNLTACDISSVPDEDDTVDIAILSLAMWGSNGLCIF
jgi:hypothetical protein